MRRLAIAWLALALGGCTCLFDPSKVPGSAGCPDGGSSCPAGCSTAQECPAITNATATCASGACSHACTTGFVDVDGDLLAATTNGCERDCRSPVAPANPGSLIATVGPPGEVAFTWPEANPPADGYLICSGPDAGTCTSVKASSCDAGQCAFSLQGQTRNTRILNRLRSVNGCGTEGTLATAPVVSVTPIDGRSPGGFEVVSTCNPNLTAISEGVIIDQAGGFYCPTLLKVGDDLWSDGTAEVEVFLQSAAQSPDIAGLVMQVDNAGHYVGVGVSAKDVDRPLVLIYRPPAGNLPITGASSVHLAPTGQWVKLRLTASAGRFSFQTGPAAGPLTERLRWPSPVLGAATVSGKPGIAVVGPGRADFRNFTLSTASKLPDAGSTSVAYPLTTQLPPDWRLRGSAPVTEWAKCPAAANATNCTVAGGCGPGDAGCFHVTRQAFAASGLALFDLPVGVDVSQPWSYSLRFLAGMPGSAGFAYPTITATANNPGTLLGALNWGANLVCAQTDLMIPLELNRWHQAVWRFIPDGGQLSLTLDGTQLPTITPPNAWQAHPGAFQLGGGVVMEAWMTDVKISQP